MSEREKQEIPPGSDTPLQPPTLAQRLRNLGLVINHHKFEISAGTVLLLCLGLTIDSCCKSNATNTVLGIMGILGGGGLLRFIQDAKIFYENGSDQTGYIKN